MQRPFRGLSKVGLPSNTSENIGNGIIPRFSRTLISLEMTTFLLIRHAAHDLLGRTLAGRASDVHLNARGKMEAERLAERLADVPIRGLYTGPLERAQETAWPLASKLMLALRVHEGVDEINFGDWT